MHAIGASDGPESPESSRESRRFFVGSNLFVSCAPRDRRSPKSGRVLDNALHLSVLSPVPTPQPTDPGQGSIRTRIRRRMRRSKGQKGFYFGMRGRGSESGETPRASLTSVGLYSVCLSVCLSLFPNCDRSVQSGSGVGVDEVLKSFILPSRSADARHASGTRVPETFAASCGP